MVGFGVDGHIFKVHVCTTRRVGIIGTGAINNNNGCLYSLGAYIREVLINAW